MLFKIDRSVGPRHYGDTCEKQIFENFKKNKGKESWHRIKALQITLSKTFDDWRIYYLL